MTEDRLKGIESTWRLGVDDHGNAFQRAPPALVAMEQVKELLAEVHRLRWLIKEAEKSDRGDTCPWCQYYVGDFKRKHAPECPAFTENGDVR